MRIDIIRADLAQFSFGGTASTDSQGWLGHLSRLLPLQECGRLLSQALACPVVYVPGTGAYLSQGSEDEACPSWHHTRAPVWSYPADGSPIRY